MKGRVGNVAAGLGPLEVAVVDIVCAHGESTVHDVVNHLPFRRAYTTVMTTLDRLYMKGVLERRCADRRFLYRARWELLIVAERPANKWTGITNLQNY